LPFELRDDFAWLARQSAWEEHGLGDEMGEENEESLRLLRLACEHAGVKLPIAFVRFMSAPDFHKRIRSYTDCYLDLCPAPIASPVGEGHLIRFLADSQACIFWYLFVTKDGTDHAVVSSPGFYGTKDEEWQDEVPDPSQLSFTAESFEAFMCRLWLENEIWFAQWQKTPMPQVGEQYIELYRSKA
jgi:hypothetical protein